MRFLVTIISLISFLKLFGCANFNDERCDVELSQFDLALDKREFWALRSESNLLIPDQFANFIQL